VRSVATVTTLWAAATAYQWYTNNTGLIGEVHAEEVSSKEEKREALSSQHLQVKKSWEHPGVYAWGSNSGKVVAPDSDEVYIKKPRRIAFFDGRLLHDLKLDRNFGVAIDENGDLLQWGTAFSNKTSQPTYTLRGKKLRSLALSRDRVLALSASGTVYSLPVSQKEQQEGPKLKESSWSSWLSLPGLSSTATISYRVHNPSSLSWNESIKEVKSGLEHALMLTTKGRVFSFASGSQDYPSRGQLGIPGLTWETRPSAPFDLPHELTSLTGFHISNIAAGDRHSIVRDSLGRVFTFGDNSVGQLGFDYSSESPYYSSPSLLPLENLYPTSSQTHPSVTNIFAGGNTSFFTVDSVKPSSSSLSSSSSTQDLSRIISDTLACGYGVTGQLGNGRFTHCQAPPVKVPAFSGLFEFDERSQSVIPIRLSYLSVGSSHAAAVLDNVASTGVAPSSDKSANDTNWGRDILFFGNNEFYQIGTGKRNNVPAPTYLQPLDQDAEAERTAAGTVKGLLGWSGTDGEKEHRFQITPRTKVRVGGRTVEMEQKVECGRGVTAVFSAV